MKVKFESKGITKSVEFDEKDDILTLNNSIGMLKLIVKLKVSSDKIEMIKTEEPTKKDESELQTFSNGNKIIQAFSDFETANEKYIRLIDKNNKVIKEVEVLKKNYYYVKYNDQNKIIFNLCIDSQGDIISQSLELWDVNSLKKIGEIKTGKFYGLNLLPSAIKCFLLKDNTIILSLGGDIIVTDLETFAIKKQFNICTDSSFVQHFKIDNENIWSLTKKQGRLYKWNINGKVSEVTYSNKIYFCSGGVLINNNKELFITTNETSQKNVFVESIEDTE